MSQTLWITGVAGFTGQHLCRFINGLSDGPRIVGLDIVQDQPQGLASYHRVDLLDMQAVEALARIDPPTWVIHLAAVLPPADEAQMWRINVGGTAGLLGGLLAGECNGARVVSVGSAAEYLLNTSGAITETSPCGGASTYGRTKWSQSSMVLGVGSKSAMDTLVVRPFNLLGPGVSSTLVVGWLCQQFACESELDKLQIGNVKSARDFVDVRDAVSAYWLAATQGQPGEIYNVCSGVPVSIEELLAILCELSGKSPRITIDPSRVRPSDPPVVFGDYSRLHRTTGWQPRIALKDSLADMLNAQAGP